MNEAQSLSSELFLINTEYPGSKDTFLRGQRLSFEHWGENRAQEPSVLRRSSLWQCVLMGERRYPTLPSGSLENSDPFSALSEKAVDSGSQTDEYASSQTSKAHLSSALSSSFALG